MIFLFQFCSFLKFNIVFSCSLLCIFSHGLHPLDIQNRVKAVAKELQETMLTDDNSLCSSPTIQKLEEMIDNGKIVILQTRFLQSLDSIKQHLADFVLSIVNNLNDRFADGAVTSIFELTKVFMQQNIPTSKDNFLSYSDKNLHKLQDFYNGVPNEEIESEDSRRIVDEWYNFKYEVLRNRGPDDT